MSYQQKQFTQPHFAHSQWQSLLPHLPQMQQLMLQLMVMCHISSRQLTQLRIKDVDWQTGHIHLFDHSLRLVRRVAIPEALQTQLKIQCMQVKSLWQADRQHGWVKVQLPAQLAHLENSLGKRQEWQFLFPASRVSHSYAASVIRRSPMSCAALNNEFARAGRIARIRDLALVLSPKGGKTQPGSAQLRSKARPTNVMRTLVHARPQDLNQSIPAYPDRPQLDLFSASV